MANYSGFLFIVVGKVSCLNTHKIFNSGSVQKLILSKQKYWKHVDMAEF